MSTERETPYLQLVAERNELAKALWAVRVLDRWSKYDGPQRGQWYVCQLGVCALHKQPQDIHPPRFFEGPTPDAARIAAAEALVAEDPTLGEGL